ncbi:MAG TPA: hypothetical protein VK607_05660, partial [Kofleriaceae bacterium]|nr:hypothetical protein [Kofleriaceae bacterium]
VAGSPRPVPAPPRIARSARSAEVRNPEAEAHLRDAEAAFQANQPLRQLAAADLALRADPRSVRARYLLGDALIKSGDLDNGCKYLATLKRVSPARERARAAGCPSD